MATGFEGTTAAGEGDDGRVLPLLPAPSLAQQYQVKPIPPYRRTSNTVDSSSNNTNNSRSLPPQIAGPAVDLAGSNANHNKPGRERRQSQASGVSSSSASSSRRNSGNPGAAFVRMGSSGSSSGAQHRYPSPAPSSPASSPTHAQAQFIGVSEAMRRDPSTSSSSGSATAAAPMAGYHSSTYAPQASTSSSSAALLQGIEAQLQIPPFRGNSSSTRSSATATRQLSPLSASVRPGEQQQQRQQMFIAPTASSSTTAPAQQHHTWLNTSASSGLTAGAPQAYYTLSPQHDAYYQNQQQPSSSSSYLPVLQSQQHTPQAAHHFSQSAIGGPHIVTSAQTTSAAAAHAAAVARDYSRNRASHQIAPVSASHATAASSGAASGQPGYAQTQQPINIALHTAQYMSSTSNRPKLFFGNYQLLHTLGEGEFGKVKLCVHSQRWGEEVAIKLIKKGSIENAARHLKVQREIDVLKVVKHPHIVRLHEVVETDRYIGIVLEYASGTSRKVYSVRGRLVSKAPLLFRLTKIDNNFSSLVIQAANFSNISSPTSICARIWPASSSAS